MSNILFVGAMNQIAQSSIKVLETSGMGNWEIWYTYYSQSEQLQKLYGAYKGIFFDIKMNEAEILSSLTLPCFECIVVTAWCGADGENLNNSSVQAQNVLALYSLLTKLKSKKIILLGSQAEYGIKSKEVDELVMEEPITEYGKAKLELYNKMTEFCREKDIRIIELRIHSCYGTWDDDRKVLFKVIHDLSQGKTVSMRSNCLQLWDFLFVADIGEAICKAIMTDIEDGVYNISNGEFRSLREYLEIAYSVVQKGKLVFGSESAKNVPNFLFLSDKFRKATGWIPQTNFYNGCGIVRDYLMMLKRAGV